MKTLVAIVLLSYLVGAIPWSWLLTRLRGVDLRRVGSGNLGATNTFRALGAPAAILVLLLDIAKGWVAPTILARVRLDTPVVDPALLPVCAGVAAVVGHIFSPYLGLRGGKGIATSAGAFMAIEPRALVVALMAFLFGVLVTRGIVSVGSLLGTLALPGAVYFEQAREAQPLWGEVVLTSALALLIVAKHTSNLRRLVHGQEKRLFGSRAASPNARRSP